MTWDIELPQAGRYEVALVYCCPASDIGATIRVAVGDAHLEKTLDLPHDPAPIARPDRVPRWEVPDKKFADCKLGALALQQGRITLSVRAAKTPGGDAMELQAVRLRRLP